MPVTHKTPARIALLKELWPQDVDMVDILDRLNALPAPGVATRGDVYKWISKIPGLKRSTAFYKRVYAVNAAKATAAGIAKREERRRMAESTIPSVFVERAFDTSWPRDQIDELRALWEAGHSTAEIGRRMFTTKNAIVGKAHRLDLPRRPSPIRRNGEPYIRRASQTPRVTGPTLAPLQTPVPLMPVLTAAPKPAPRLVVVAALPAAPVVAVRVWTPPTPRPTRAPVVAPTTPVYCDRATIMSWATQRGIMEFDLEQINGKRAVHGLAPFAVEEWTPRSVA